MFTHEPNVFQPSTDVVGLMSGYTRSQTANSEGTPSGMSHHEEDQVQQPAHGN